MSVGFGLLLLTSLAKWVSNIVEDVHSIRETLRLQQTMVLYDAMKPDLSLVTARRTSFSSNVVPLSAGSSPTLRRGSSLPSVSEHD